MDDRNLVPRTRPDTLVDGSSTWSWIVATLCLAFVFVLLFTMSSGERIQVASHAPPAIDGMVMPPITQPTSPSQ
jgi:hypothetical protein